MWSGEDNNNDENLTHRDLVIKTAREGINKILNSPAGKYIEAISLDDDDYDSSSFTLRVKLSNQYDDISVGDFSKESQEVLPAFKSVLDLYESYSFSATISETDEEEGDSVEFVNWDHSGKSLELDEIYEKIKESVFEDDWDFWLGVPLRKFEIWMSIMGKDLDDDDIGLVLYFSK